MQGLIYIADTPSKEHDFSLLNHFPQSVAETCQSARLMWVFIFSSIRLSKASLGVAFPKTAISSVD